MSILKTIKDVMFSRRRELGEQADSLRSAGKFIDAAIADARESEIRFAINTIKNYEAFFPGDDARSDRQESVIVPGNQVPHWERDKKNPDFTGPVFVTGERSGKLCVLYRGHRIALDDLFDMLPKFE